MRRVRKLSFSELVEKNKQQILNDEKALERIEERLEKRRVVR